MREDHLRDGLYVALGTCKPDSADDSVFLVALDIAFWYWIDDQSDQSLMKSQSSVHWDSLLTILSPDVETAAGVDSQSDEIFLTGLKQMVANASPTNDDLRYWCATAASTLRSMRFEEEVSRGLRLAGSFVECLENGTNSISVLNILATVMIAQNTSRAAIWYDDRSTRLERIFASLQRLTNDLFSAEKERKEGHAGRLSNSVLFLEKLYGQDLAFSFVKACRSGYRDLLESELDALGPQNPIGVVCRRMHHCIDRYYEDRPVRYD